MWEDGTGVDIVEGAQPHSIDYYYVADIPRPIVSASDCLASKAETLADAGPPATEAEAVVDTATFPVEWFGQKRRRVEEHISQEEEEEEEEEEEQGESGYEEGSEYTSQDALVTVSPSHSPQHSLPSDAASSR